MSDLTKDNLTRTETRLIIDKINASTFADLTSASTIAAIATADATTLTTALALANANKAKINDMIEKLKTANIIA